MGKKAIIFKARCLHGNCGRRCDGYKWEGHAHSMTTGAANVTVGTKHSHQEPEDLLAKVLTRTNMQQAYERVLCNTRSP